MTFCQKALSSEVPLGRLDPVFSYPKPTPPPPPPPEGKETLPTPILNPEVRTTRKMASSLPPLGIFPGMQSAVCLTPGIGHVPFRRKWSPVAVHSGSCCANATQTFLPGACSWIVSIGSDSGCWQPVNLKPVMDAFGHHFLFLSSLCGCY